MVGGGCAPRSLVILDRSSFSRIVEKTGRRLIGL